MKSLLTIAGLDPSGGAGLAQDLGVFSSQGFHGLCVPTALVPQGPRGVHAVIPVGTRELASMLDVLEQEVENLAGVKIGVLSTGEQAERVVAFLLARAGTRADTRAEMPVVIDPVLSAKNGVQLTSREALQALLENLRPLCPVVTPNLSEAEILTGLQIRDLASMKEGARALCTTGAGAVVVKGGHLPQTEEPTDLFCDGREVVVHKKKRVPAEIHGTGCLFSALLLTFLARGYVPVEAFLATEAAMEEALEMPYLLGQGGYHYSSLSITRAQEAERFRVLRALREAAQLLKQLAPVELVPAVQMNLGYALREAETVEEVAAFPGRIGTWDNQLLFKEEPAFGASSHIARLILTMMRRFPHMRACLNLRFSQRVVAKASAAGLLVLEADRRSEPQEIREAEGKSLDFLLEQVLAECTTAPDLVYDRGDFGKEPMIRLFGRTPAEVLQKLKVVKP